MRLAIVSTYAPCRSWTSCLVRLCETLLKTLYAPGKRHCALVIFYILLSSALAFGSKSSVSPEDLSFRSVSITWVHDTDTVVPNLRRRIVLFTAL